MPQMSYGIMKDKHLQLKLDYALHLLKEIDKQERNTNQDKALIELNHIGKDIETL